MKPDIMVKTFGHNAWWGQARLRIMKPWEIVHGNYTSITKEVFEEGIMFQTTFLSVWLGGIVV